MSVKLKGILSANYEKTLFKTVSGTYAVLIEHLDKNKEVNSHSYQIFGTIEEAEYNFNKVG